MIDEGVHHRMKLPQLLLLSFNLLQLVLKPLRGDTNIHHLRGADPDPDTPTEPSSELPAKLSILYPLTVSDSFILMVILLTASDALLIILRNPAPLRVWVFTALGS